MFTAGIHLSAVSDHLLGGAILQADSLVGSFVAFDGEFAAVTGRDFGCQTVDAARFEIAPGAGFGIDASVGESVGNVNLLLRAIDRVNDSGGKHIAVAARTGQSDAITAQRQRDTVRGVGHVAEQAVPEAAAARERGGRFADDKRYGGEFRIDILRPRVEPNARRGMRERESPVVICNCITEIAVRPELQFVWNVLVLNRRYAGFTAVSSHVVENTVRGFARQTFETESGRCAVDTGLGALHVVHPDTVGGTPCEENSASVVRCELRAGCRT